MKHIKRSLGLKLREIRKSHKYTQETLAEKLDLSTRQLIRIENGQNFPSVETLGKISKFFDIELYKLFDFRDNSLSQESDFTDTLKMQELHSYIFSKLSNMSLTLNQLEYLKLAIDLLEDPKALNEFKNLLKSKKTTQ